MQAHPKASRIAVELRDGVYHVYVRSAPEQGKATEEVRKVFAEFLGVPRKRLRCRSGESSRRKIFELSD